MRADINKGYSLVEILGSVLHGLNASSYKDAALELGIKTKTLNEWVKQYGEKVIDCEHGDMAKLASEMEKEEVQNRFNRILNKYTLPKQLKGEYLNHRMKYFFNKSRMTKTDFKIITGIDYATVRGIINGKKIRAATLEKLTANLPYSSDDWMKHQPSKESAVNVEKPIIETIKSIPDTDNIPDNRQIHDNALSYATITPTIEQVQRLEERLNLAEDRIMKLVDNVIALMQSINNRQNYRNNNYQHQAYQHNNHNYRNNSASDIEKQLAEAFRR